MEYNTAPWMGRFREAKVITTQKYPFKESHLNQILPKHLSSLHHWCPNLKASLASYWVSTSIVSIQTQNKVAVSAKLLWKMRCHTMVTFEHVPKRQITSQTVTLGESSGKIIQQVI